MLHRRFLAAGIALIGSLVSLLLTADRLKNDIVTLEKEREEVMLREAEDMSAEADGETVPDDLYPEAEEEETE